MPAHPESRAAVILASSRPDTVHPPRRRLLITIGY